ncbi:MAG TPA: Ca2+-dependent phosphoinositide-specific phospholipase C, partial [Verrucomicrobiae bacterium]|nr:Ca2+-dependent phosphoinositide-specific phospholipase C [Verrucomicrobiae bacterium]
MAKSVMTLLALLRSNFTLALASILAVAEVAAAEPRLNEIQVIGTHNSYHIAPHDSILRLIAEKNPGGAASLNYTHRPLPEQFDRGIRQVELDIYNDPKGGLFADPKGNQAAAARGWSFGANYDPHDERTKPGFQILHIPDIDFRATVLTLRAGLTQIRDWSRLHPRHLPIFILLELKDETVSRDFAQPIPFDAAALDALDAGIRSVFNTSELILPDTVRGGSATLPEAIRTRGWPTLAESRGKVLFGLDNEGEVRNLYLQGHPALQGRVMF